MTQKRSPSGVPGPQNCRSKTSGKEGELQLGPEEYSTRTSCRPGAKVMLASGVMSGPGAL